MTTLSADEISRAFWYANSRGIKFRWDPALVAKLAAVTPQKYLGDPQWLRIMPRLTAWTVLDG